MVAHLVLGMMFLMLPRQVFTSVLHGLFDARVLLGLPLALFVLWRRVDRRISEDTNYWVLVQWAASGTAVTFLLVILYMLSASLIRVLPPEPALLSILAADIGGLAGTLLGIQVLRVRVAERRAERAEIHASRSERTREILTFLNRMLRHQVLNGLNLVDGFVSNLEPHVPDDHQPDAETTGARIDEMVDYVEEIQFTVTALSRQIEPTQIDVTALVERECDRARKTYPSATIETELPADLQIRGTSLLGRVFRHLLENAVVPDILPRLKVVGFPPQTGAHDGGRFAGPRYQRSERDLRSEPCQSGSRPR